MDINNVNFDPKKTTSRYSFWEEIIKHHENHQSFSNKKALTTLKGADGFSRSEVYNPKSPLYVDQSSLYPSLEKTIEMIHQAGGLAFLAHTFAYSPTIKEQLENIIQNYKLDGLECYYTTFTEEQTKYLLDMCDKHNLYKSGGSDYHGTNKVNHNLGIGNGTMKIDESLISEWYSRKN